VTVRARVGRPAPAAPTRAIAPYSAAIYPSPSCSRHQDLTAPTRRSQFVLFSEQTLRAKDGSRHVQLQDVTPLSA